METFTGVLYLPLVVVGDHGCGPGAPYPPPPPPPPHAHQPHTQCTPSHTPPPSSPQHPAACTGVCWVRSGWVGQVRSDLVRSCQVMSSLPGTCQRPLHGNQHTAISLNFAPLLKRIRFPSTSPSPPHLSIILFSFPSSMDCSASTKQHVCNSPTAIHNQLS